MKEAYLYSKLDKNRVECRLCHHRCVIGDDKVGICRVRKNEGGKLYATEYHNTAVQRFDFMEKKPMMHFLPGELSYSVCTYGCNFDCEFCQNAHYSQKIEETFYHFTPAEIVKRALGGGAKVVVFPYTEPTVYYELVKDTSILAVHNGLKTCWITNGFMTTEVLEDIQPYLHGANVDIKSFSEEYYQNVCKGSLQPVLDNIVWMKEHGIWVEVTTLLCAGENDSDDEIQAIAEWIVSVDRNMPWMLDKYTPLNRWLDHPVLNDEVVRRAYDIGRAAGVHYIYTANIDAEWGYITQCHNCSEKLADRDTHVIRHNYMVDGSCPSCGTTIPGVWK